MKTRRCEFCNTEMTPSVFSRHSQKKCRNTCICSTNECQYTCKKGHLLEELNNELQTRLDTLLKRVAELEDHLKVLDFNNLEISIEKETLLSACSDYFFKSATMNSKKNINGYVRILTAIFEIPKNKGSLVLLNSRKRLYTARVNGVYTPVTFEYVKTVIHQLINGVCLKWQLDPETESAIFLISGITDEKIARTLRVMDPFFQKS